MPMAKMSGFFQYSLVKIQLFSIFTRHGIPELIVSVNGPQYSSEEFSKVVLMSTCHEQSSVPAKQW